MNKSSLITFSILTIATAVAADAQITLSGSLYEQNFNSLGSGLPEGWSVRTGATLSLSGTTAVFNTPPTSWSATRDSGGVFRNTSSSNISSSSLAGPQGENTNRALGWRPSQAAERDGAITVEFANTLGFVDFSVSLTVFTFNDVTAVSTYDFEYRVGESGAFQKLDSYTTGAPFSEVTFSFSSSALAALDNQEEPVFFRLRGTGSGTGSLDGVAIDNFSLSYSPVAAVMPEPASAVMGAGVVAIAFAAAGRRRR